ncbi:MAG: lipase family protein [Gammaproteobacteria bacterium]|nr:lipase family protein [Gammaproteobacteria bacterium]
MKNIVIKAAEYSAKAYEEATISKESTQVLVMTESDATWIAFRGTEAKLKDITADAKIRKEVTDIGEIHRGFNDAYMLVNDDIIVLAKEAKDAGNKLYITGHSLGGALATVAALYFNLNGLSPDKVITFGCPRVLSKETAEKVNSNHKQLFCRVVNNNDVVTRVPPRTLDYSHIGELWYYRESGELVMDNDLSWWDLFWDRIDGRLEDFGELGTDGLKDHFMDNYKKQLGII